MKLLEKCYQCYDKKSYNPHYCANEVYAENRNKAICQHIKSGFDDATYISTKCYRFPKYDKVLVDSKIMYRYEVNSYFEHKKWREKIDELLLEKPNEKCYIFSWQWNLYWRQNASGYTVNQQEAGVYTVKEAHNLVYHCGIEKGIEIRLIK